MAASILSYYEACSTRERVATPRLCDTHRQPAAANDFENLVERSRARRILKTIADGLLTLTYYLDFVVIAVLVAVSRGTCVIN